MRLVILPSIILASTFAVSCSGGSGTPNDSVDFTVAGQIENEFLAITMEFTAAGAVPVASQLLRGKQKANSAVADLKVMPTASGVETHVYYMQDPRFFRIEGSEWRVETKIDAIVFVPLSSTIDGLVIEPMPGRRAFVSAGGTFDPRGWAIAACRTDAGTSYSECPDVLALAASGAFVTTP